MRIELREGAERDPIVLGALLGYDTPKHHRRWVDAYRKHENLVVLSPADHGKTTLFGLLVPLQEMVADRNVRIGYVTANGAIAESVLRTVRQTLEGEEFQGIFGDLKPRNPSRWTSSEIQIERGRVLKDATMFAGGLWSAIINRRFDVLICDDICDDENMGTLESRRKVKQRFYEVMLPCVEPGGKVVVIGTRQHADDVYADLLRNDLWVTIVEQAIRGKESLWPERWSMEALERKRKEVGEEAFGKRYLNIANPEGRMMFPPEWVGQCLDETIEICPTRSDLPARLREARIVQAVDVASSGTMWGAHFAHITVAVEPPVGEEFHPKLTVLTMERKRLAWPRQRELIVREAEAWGPNVLLVESNGVQQLVLQDLAAGAGSHLPLQASYTGREKGSLDVGIPYLSSLVKAARIRIPWKGEATQRVSWMLREELEAWPKGKSDDLMMALWFVVKESRYGGKAREPDPDFHMMRPRMRFRKRRYLPREPRPMRRAV